ncbi:TPA: ParB/RepB/Spo0J family partition protein [Legionella pneumophila]|uniref:ParB/RepB/Spo0J family partition protein n=1 Tax=Legionella pneumophila TaxID=446 RepID=UPI0007785858|nr:ParB/RepB/Spo0J family partition protein [Legionella pneumophila]HAT8623323.1 ParB/RepB/Spo0J family partition protein [Legionella pneumophila]HAU1410298.1 ParB/RepB/Spo0J family partition protein [Legionella pneumophila]HCC3170278.1 ParB/RepB/Spo0J family partition protein [Legionella pneumophila]HCC3179508.1 ParB/RepB/Spo0J family partition protein [Legionella pneumophila]HCC3185458.1 ParB/RepB/Spo0J family partition protein [Legionella pneumophila]
MDNSKRNVHNSGPLGMLMKSGQVKKIETSEEEVILKQSVPRSPSYFKTQSGIEFTEQELIYVNPEECEPWKYANRQEGELGDIDGLIDSIKSNKQLQPALVRNHPNPHGKIKYEVIFGRRRHIACMQLGIPFLVIRKDIPNVQDAIASQDAENKLRNDVSNYSNAMLYKRLLLDNVFKTEKELSEKLRISYSTFNELMAYSKIPDDIVRAIPDIHNLSKQLAVKIVQLINKSKDNYNKMLSIANQLGRTITSQAKLEKIFEEKTLQQKVESTSLSNAKSYISINGKKLFTFKSDYRGFPSIVLHKEIAAFVNVEDMCKHVSAYLEKIIAESEYSD